MTGARPEWRDPDNRLARVTVHVRTETDYGPDYCHPCSDAIGDWVPWPCPGYAARSAIQAEGARSGVDVDDLIRPPALDVTALPPWPCCGARGHHTEDCPHGR